MRTTILIIIAATCYMTLSGFECASTEMTTAKVAIGRKDYNKAEENLRKEVQAHPQNGEAWLLLAQIYEEQKRWIDMSDAFTKALNVSQPPLDESRRQQIISRRYNAWINAYNGAVNALNSNDYALAMRRMDTATALRPDHAESVVMRAQIARAQQDSAAEIRYYQDYARRIRPEVDRGLALDLRLGMSPSAVDAKLGASSESRFSKDGGYAFYAKQSVGTYFDAQKDDSTKLTLSGWKFFEATDPPMLHAVPRDIISNVYYDLGVIAYEQGASNPESYNDALGYFQIAEQLDPRFENVGRLIAQIYVTTGRTDEARTLFEKNIRNSPNDPILHIAYGNFLLELKDYQGAIKHYEEATKVAEAVKDNERFRQAQFNLGAAYKNWGAALQDSIRRASSARPTRQQEEVYLAKLRESAKHFERLRQIQGEAHLDVNLMVELANLYQVLDDKPRQKQLLSALESLESQQGKNVEYWRAMERLYVNLGDNAKAERAYKKGKEITGE